jgi:hypothetical protein
MASANAPKTPEQAVSRDKRGRWMKGTSPNTRGRPRKDRWFAQEVQAFLEEKDPETRRLRLLELLEAGYAKAKEGDTSAARALKEWAYGKETTWLGDDTEASERELERIATAHGRTVDDVRRMAEERGIRLVS